MRLVTDADKLDAAWQQAASEAALAFGDASLFAERLITGARHVEVQIAADGEHAISVGTRDCSLQRRHQKVVETAPAAPCPQLEAAACSMAEKLGYRGLGTWEFWCRRIVLVHGSQSQATGGTHRHRSRHRPGSRGVQLRLAEGASLVELGLSQPPAIRGFAIQLRINAETLTSAGDTIPETGRIGSFQPPAARACGWTMPWPKACTSIRPMTACWPN